MKKHIWVILTGAVIGALALLLSALGNPGNMGFCIACFLRDIAGACKLHTAGVVQYVRPEIAGLVIGAFIAAVAAREFKPRGGSSPVTRFVIGFAVMVGALMFLGCPLRMVLRLGAGDLNALVGLVGFAGGVGLGVLALNKGFSLGRAYPQPLVEGCVAPFAAALITVLVLLVPSLFAFSAEGPGSLHAPVLVSLLAGLAVGALAQRSRFCMAGGIRDVMLFKDMHLLWGLIALLAVVAAGTLALGKFAFGFEGQPVAHTDGVWNFLGMALVGLGSVMLGGCPLRQLILAGEGSSDSSVTVIGFIAGAAFCHNFGLASSANGPTSAGKIAVVACFAGLVAIALTNILRKGKK